jgi:hypothetical protein
MLGVLALNALRNKNSAGIARMANTTAVNNKTFLITLSENVLVNVFSKIC